MKKLRLRIESRLLKGKEGLCSMRIGNILECIRKKKLYFLVLILLFGFKEISHANSTSYQTLKSEKKITSLEKEVLKLREDIYSTFQVKESKLQEVKEFAESQKTRNPCFSRERDEKKEDRILIFMSFSVPDNIWLSLSKEMKKTNVVFVLRGLPQGSFKSLIKKINHLKMQGMNAEVQINPISFKKFDITQVPTFVFLTGEKINKISGAVSLSWVREKLSSKL